MLKKLFILCCFLLLLCGCGKEKEEDILKDFINSVEKVKSYKLTGNMEISNDEETFTYSLESYYLKDDYYKVILVNQTNNHEQIILKTGSDIYVITPSLNKSFKFQSEWPYNSSQAYLLDIIAADIKSDEASTVTTQEDGYIIKSNVNYPNNSELKYQKVYLDDDKKITKIEVFDENDIVKIKVVFDNVDMKANLKKDDFKLEDYIKEEEQQEDNKENEENCEEEKCDNKPTEETSGIEDIIYPLYIPSNTFLTSSETVDTASGNRVILTFSGDKNFVLIEEKSFSLSEMEIVPVYGEPLMLSETIGALSANSLSWDVNDISYYLASNDLTVEEMRNIANSLGNTTLVNGTK